jgi:hypothetical protein
LGLEKERSVMRFLHRLHRICVSHVWLCLLVGVFWWGACQPVAPSEPVAEANIEFGTDASSEVAYTERVPDEPILERSPDAKSEPAIPKEPVADADAGVEPRQEKPTEPGKEPPPEPRTEPVSDANEPYEPTPDAPREPFQDANGPDMRPSEPLQEPVKEVVLPDTPKEHVPEFVVESMTEPMMEAGVPESPPEPPVELPPEQPVDASPACVPAVAPAPSSTPWVQTTADGSTYPFLRELRVDAKGFLYIIGEIVTGKAKVHNTTVDATSGVQFFLAKLNANGQFIWVKQLAGSGMRKVRGLAVDAQGNSYLAGEFYGTIKVGSSTLTASSLDLFVARLDTCGNVIWVSQGGGASSDWGQSIALDAKGNVYVYGQYSGPATFGSLSVKTQDSSSIFVTKLDTNGAFQWVATGGGVSPDNPTGIAVTPQGEAYISGSSFSPVSFGSLSLKSAQAFELFVAGLDVNGKWKWAKQTTGTGRIVPYRTAFDPKGNLYITGELDGNKTFGSMALSAPAHGDIFLLQMDTKGSFNWVLRPKGTFHLHPYGLAFDSASRIYLAGDYTGDPAFGTTKFPNSNNVNSFVTRALATPGFNWATRTKGSDDVRAQALAVGPNGHLYVGGVLQTGGTFGNITIKKTAFSFHLWIWKIPKP